MINFSVALVNTGKMRKPRITQSTRFDLYNKFRKTCNDESLINRSTPRLHDTYDIAAPAIFVLVVGLVSCHHDEHYKLRHK